MNKKLDEHQVRALWDGIEFEYPPPGVESGDLRKIADWLDGLDYEAAQVEFNKQLDFALRCYIGDVEDEHGVSYGPNLAADIEVGTITVCAGECDEYKAGVPLESAFWWVDEDPEDLTEDFDSGGWIPLLEGLIEKLRKFEEKKQARSK